MQQVKPVELQTLWFGVHPIQSTPVECDFADCAGVADRADGADGAGVADLAGAFGLANAAQESLYLQVNLRLAMFTPGLILEISSFPRQQ
jgi:hypothetical protein